MVRCPPHYPSNFMLTSYLVLGSALASTGDNGKVHIWKKGLEGQYYEFSETAPM